MVEAEDARGCPRRLITFREKKSLQEHSELHDRTLAVHSMRSITPTDRRFACIEDKDDGTQNVFGLTREKSFCVVVDIVPKAAMYIRERIWSRDQVITPKKNGGLTLEFTAASKPEVLAWVLSFGGEATFREPEDIRKEIYSRSKILERTHQDS